MFVGTFVIYNQLKYIQNKNLGFDKEQVIVINKTDDIGKQMKSFKEELSNNSLVTSVSNSNGIPGDQKGDSAYRIDGSANDEIQDLRKTYLL